jgi:hypothetical protein
MTNAEKIVLIMELRESIEQTTGSYLATLVITLLWYMYCCKS